MFSIPILSYYTNSNGELNSVANEKILRYKNVIDNNPLLLNKAFFYTADEPNWTSEDEMSSYTSLNNARIKLGNALSAANTEHNFQDFETAVYPDETHNGLEIRTCETCGTEESRKTDCVAHTVGDINIDGIVDLNDYAMLNAYVACDISLRTEQKAISDLDSDNAVDFFDAIWLDLFINHQIDINGNKIS